MKKTLASLTSILTLIAACAPVTFALLTGCGPIEDDGIEMVGYYKGDNKLRYMTFFVEGYADLDRRNIPADLKEKLVAHGSSQMHTEGRATAVFYYTEEGAAPDRMRPGSRGNWCSLPSRWLSGCERSAGAPEGIGHDLVSGFTHYAAAS